VPPGLVAREVTLSGKGSLRRDETWSLADVRVASEAASFGLSGNGKGQTGKFDLLVELQRLSILHPGIEGATTVTSTIELRPDGSAGGSPWPNLPSTSRAHTSPKVTCWLTRSSMSTPRYRSAPPSLSGSAISVVKATTPSSPGTKSSGTRGDTLVMGRFLHLGRGLCLPVGNQVADERSMNRTQNRRGVALSRGDSR